MRRRESLRSKEEIAGIEESADGFRPQSEGARRNERRRARLPSVSGGSLTTGRTKDYAIELKAGDYVYSCPLNPTPDYKLVVRD